MIIFWKKSSCCHLAPLKKWVTHPEVGFWARHHSIYYYKCTLGNNFKWMNAKEEIFSQGNIAFRYASLFPAWCGQEIGHKIAMNWFIWVEAFQKLETPEHAESKSSTNCEPLLPINGASHLQLQDPAKVNTLKKANAVPSIYLKLPAW